MSRHEEIFAEALDIPVAARAAFLDGACPGDPALRAEIEELLAGYEEVERDMPRIVSPAQPLAGEKSSDRIGRYKLLEKIGEGGCGVVWMAEQEEPVRRRVALKVIKLGMDTKAVIARFEAERQALAMMDHPNIAKVLDAGATESGRPFFVMELVRGLPITTYCDKHQLPPRARLELLIAVCAAIQHAHEKGIIHRDIKPSNILITINDGAAVPKVIDFGIAKATQGRLTEHTLFTAFEQFIGTPVYMSPEQAEMSSLEVDARSDVYSLGVLLYELLTGQAPFDPKALARTGVDEIRRQIREVEPPRPSTRWRTLTDAQRSSAANLRGTAPAELSVLLRGDLDWIVMRCLEKERARRYDSANALAEDIRRHLRHEPVVARPPSAVYVVGKFVRRHRVAVVASAAVIAALGVGAISTWRARRTLEAERLAAQQRAPAPNPGLDLAKRASAIYDRSLGYGRDDLVLAEDFARRATDLEPTSAYAWGVRAHVQAAFLYRGFSVGDEAARRARDAQSFANRALAVNADETDALLALGRVANVRGAFVQAEELLARAWAAHPNDNRVVRTLAYVLRNQPGRLPESLALSQEAVKREPGNALAHYDLAAAYVDASNYPAAWRESEATVSLQPFSSALIQKATLAIGYKGDLPEMRAAIDRLSPAEQTEDRPVVFSMLCALYERRPERVIAAAATTSRDYFEDNYWTGPKAWLLALAYGLAGQENSARAEWARAEEVVRARLASDSQDRNLKIQLAITLAGMGRTEEAMREAGPVEALWREKMSREQERLFASRGQERVLARFYARAGDAPKAVHYLRQVLHSRPLFSVPALRLDPWWDKLRGTPEFEDLLAHPPPMPPPIAPAPYRGPAPLPRPADSR